MATFCSLKFISQDVRHKRDSIAYISSNSSKTYLDYKSETHLQLNKLELSIQTDPKVPLHPQNSLSSCPFSG